jgi:hypothetical protein
MTKETIITISVSLLVAFSGYIAKYLNDLRIAQRKDRLERVNQQLRDLYGPLFSLINASTITWEAFRETYCSRDDFRVKQHVLKVGGSRPGIMPQSEETKRIWRHWMQNVFMPLNIEMAQLIIDYSDLLEEEDMPERRSSDLYVPNIISNNGDSSIHRKLISQAKSSPSPAFRKARVVTPTMASTGRHRPPVMPGVTRERYEKDRGLHIDNVFGYCSF